MNFHDFLLERISLGGVSTDDILSSFLPLVREVVEAHRAGQVAPLVGLADLHVDGSRIWFEEARRQDITRNDSELDKLERSSRLAVDVLTEARRTTEVFDGVEQVLRTEIGKRGDPITRPVFLPGYVVWEHELGHHDPLTDVFSLGLILASLACGLNLNEPADLERFVVHRRNLFELNPQLHPVLAQVILRMTELHRHLRAQDLPALLGSLANYRDQAIAFEVDLARLPGLHTRDPRSKSHVVLSKLRDRLFDISRRNNLLHFRAALNTLNLSQASIPLLLDFKNIREGDILVYNDELRRLLVAGKPISLNKHLNFSDAIYLPSLLERIIADARRDQQEYGFAQLRLVLCFLSWADLKARPIERYLSPLVLLPVKLTKTKGIRDTFHLEALSGEAEVNPVLRHQFWQLYGIELPETVDLAESGLESLIEYLSRKIQANEPAVSLQRLDRPRIDLIHEKAKRRVDQYRRTARVSGRGVRQFLNLDYSYDPANYHPLGIRLFATKVRTPTSRLRQIIEDRPRPRSFMTQDDAANVAEKERSFFQVHDAAEANPYLWNLDLCNLTIANFYYRRMSLVRDYETILQEDFDNPAFNATFSITPRPVGRQLPPAPPLEERFDVVLCDPTQATAIAEARLGTSYIIQGPPGTGKSQTITNLVADYVARGQRVLFVCEKRAAIDVVYARLRQCGLDGLCCLIHDSQADKKDFVLDLKQTYEDWLEAKQHVPPEEQSRTAVLNDLLGQLKPLERYDEIMLEPCAQASLAPRRLLDRCLALRNELPESSAEELEQFPHYGGWKQHRTQIAALEPMIRDLQPDGVIARHPLRLLNPQLAGQERPIELVRKGTEQAQQLLERVFSMLQKSGVPAEQWNSLRRADALVNYAQRVVPLTRSGTLSLTDPSSEVAQSFATAVAGFVTAQQALTTAQQATRAWRAKLPADDAVTALAQARQWEGKLLAWLSPAWWRLRSVLHRHYDFASHTVRPNWTRILAALQKEYEAIAARDQAQSEIEARFKLPESLPQTQQRVEDVQSFLAAQPEGLRRVHQALLKSPKSDEFVQRLLPLSETSAELRRTLDSILVDFEDLPLGELRELLMDTMSSVAQTPEALHLLGELERLPGGIGTTLRRQPLTLAQLEAGMARRTWSELCRSHREVGRFDGAKRRSNVGRLEELYDQWQSSNAVEICTRARERFLEQVRVASLPASQLSPEQREFKKAHAQGRRTLEHEFGKSMRYKSIRELVDGESGLIIRDLKPIWLMSPLSVSDTLPLSHDLFDVVIFDEASQIPLEEAVPSLFRGKQVIVVGDEMQLPPTAFFVSKASDNEDQEPLGTDAEPPTPFDLTGDSFLNHAATNLPATMLGWHYRSRNESLISFSNWAFYDGRLLTVPEECLLQSPQQAATGVELVLEQAVSFHHIPGVYDKRRNRAEAEYVAGLVRDLLLRETGFSLGVIAFSEAQQDEINGALARLCDGDDEFRQRYEDELQREVDGQFVGLLVKNLENIQGDERDIVLLSICYAPGPTGKMLMNFGPINQMGGEKRLNVAFSRAKQRMAVVSSIRAGQITNDYNAGAACLKNYLNYAEAISCGDGVGAQRVLSNMCRWREGRSAQQHVVADETCRQVASALRQRGYVVDEAVGQSHFRVDLAVRREADKIYRLGILVDTLSSYEQSEPLERDMLRPRLLRNFGWQVTSVLAKDWLDSADAELHRLITMIEQNEDERLGST
jgi:hypothetical protein